MLKIIKTFTLNFVCFFIIVSVMVISGCGKKEGGGTTPPPPPIPTTFTASFTVNGSNNGSLNYAQLNLEPQVKLTFSEAIDPATIPAGISFTNAAGVAVPYTTIAAAANKELTIKTANKLDAFASYVLQLSNALKTPIGGVLGNPFGISLRIGIDSSRKFPAISDNQLLDKVQQQTLRYFYDFGHPTSGLARERNTSGDLVTSGGSGFGIMALIVGAERNFIPKPDVFARMQKIVGFLKNTAVTVKGAFPHWLNGNTGAIIPFSSQDNGADLVETSFLIQGLICAKQYYSGSGAEATLRADIKTIVDRVEWDFFRKTPAEDQLYWHYSPTGAFAINLRVRGWNESLMTYVLAAASTTHTIPQAVYTAGWANNGGMRNGNPYFGISLPLGPAFGGPLFFEHYSFQGINPRGLTDVYANYETQTKNHALINYNYCKSVPTNGYSDSIWGLTASDIPGGYTASSPTNDKGVIAPTGALASFPYTPTESMAALKFYYYVLGDRIFKEYGFVDAFSVRDGWFASSFLAIDQGPIITMIENHRTGLLWNLFTSDPEVKAGMLKLGFSAPYL